MWLLSWRSPPPPGIIARTVQVGGLLWHNIGNCIHRGPVRVMGRMIEGGISCANMERGNDGIEQLESPEPLGWKRGLVGARYGAASLLQSNTVHP